MRRLGLLAALAGAAACASEAPLAKPPAPTSSSAEGAVLGVTPPPRFDQPISVTIPQAVVEQRGEYSLGLGGNARALLGKHTATLEACFRTSRETYGPVDGDWPITFLVDEKKTAVLQASAFADTAARACIERVLRGVAWEYEDLPVIVAAQLTVSDGASQRPPGVERAACRTVTKPKDEPAHWDVFAKLQASRCADPEVRFIDVVVDGKPVSSNALEKATLQLSDCLWHLREPGEAIPPLHGGPSSPPQPLPFDARGEIDLEVDGGGTIRRASFDAGERAYPEIGTCVAFFVAHASKEKAFGEKPTRIHATMVVQNTRAGAGGGRW